ncbi:MAG: type II toxin-antitoxin system YafQ family toxin [Prevotella sp.]|nr:type II toxin-antitoxin system YafQ family toxin [Prevotella sp.]
MNQIYEIKTYKQYERDVKRAIRRGLDIEKLLDVVRLLRQGKPLPAKFRNHLLTGDYKGFWECHITPDWLLLYQKDTEIRIISLYRTGSHADIFGKGKKR